MNSLIKNGDKIHLNLYFQVHQPRRIRPFGFFDIGKGLSFFDDDLNREIIRRVSKNCYIPANRMLLDLIRAFPQIRITFSISGVALEQFRRYSPEVLDSFAKLASSGSVEFLGETYYHSLAFLSGTDEFLSQVDQHGQLMREIFGIRPSVFRNTELIYSDEIGRTIRRLGFRGMYADGVGRILGGRSSDQLYEHIEGNGLRIFLRNHSLSDDIAFRFSDRQWKEWPLTPAKYIEWLSGNGTRGGLVNVALDYETFGEHHKADTGIFQFMKKVLAAVAKSEKFRMVTPSEAIDALQVQGGISAPAPVSWADRERDLSAWLGNDLQKDAFDNLLALRKMILQKGEDDLMLLLKYLQTSDHFYYMSTKKGDDGRVHNYFSPFPSPYEAFISYMNVLSDLSLRLQKKKPVRAAKTFPPGKRVRRIVMPV